MNEILEHFSITCPLPELRAGVIVAQGITIGDSPAPLKSQIEAYIGRLQSGEVVPDEIVKKGIRDLLRKDGYKPAGRGKPASEYIISSAMKGEFPFINSVVDINNYISLKTGLPASMLDLDKTGHQLTLRYGRNDEAYVFNQSGQEIQLKGLLCICRNNDDGDTTPLGNPVKDSMLAKTSESTTRCIGVIYGSTLLFSRDSFEKITEEFGQLIKTYGHAHDVQTAVFVAE